MRKKIIVLATVFFTVACSTTSYNIKKKYDNDIVTIKISGKMPPKEANMVVDYLFSSEKYLEDNFVIRGASSLIDMRDKLPTRNDQRFVNNNYVTRF